MSAWEGKRISANWDQQIFQFPACNGRNTRHWLGETRMKNIFVQAVQDIQSLCHLLTRAILQEFHNTKCIVYRCYLWYNYSPCMVLWRNWCEFHCARPRLHRIFINSRTSWYAIVRVCAGTNLTHPYLELVSACSSNWQTAHARGVELNSWTQQGEESMCIQLWTAVLKLPGTCLRSC